MESFIKSHDFSSILQIWVALSQKKTLWGKWTILVHFSFTKSCLLILIYHSKGNRVKLSRATCSTCITKINLGGKYWKSNTFRILKEGKWHKECASGGKPFVAKRWKNMTSRVNTTSIVRKTNSIVGLLELYKVRE